MPDVNCPGCDEVIEIEPHWYGRKVACPSCGERFVARRPGEADDEHEARPRKKVVVDDDEEDEVDRPRRKRKKRAEREQPPLPMSRGTKQLILAAAILGPILLMCLGCGGWGAFVVYAPVGYPDPWVTQALPDGSYSVQFPKKPDSPTTPFGEFGDVRRGGSRYEHVEDLPKDATFEFGSIENAPMGFDGLYKEELRGLRLTTNAKRMKEGTTTVLGRPCKEAEFSAGGGKVVFRLIDVSDRGEPRYLYLLAGGRNVSDADRNKFLDSLKAGR